MGKRGLSFLPAAAEHSAAASVSKPLMLQIQQRVTLRMCASFLHLTSIDAPRDVAWPLAGHALIALWPVLPSLQCSPFRMRPWVFVSLAAASTAASLEYDYMTSV